MRLQLNQPLSIFLLVLSILAIVVGIFFLRVRRGAGVPQLASVRMVGAVAVGYVVLRMILKRL